MQYFNHFCVWKFFVTLIDLSSSISMQHAQRLVLKLEALVFVCSFFLQK